MYTLIDSFLFDILLNLELNVKASIGLPHTYLSRKGCYIVIHTVKLAIAFFNLSEGSTN